MPKNWKYIKKLLEKEFLCEKLRGHITYDLTDYRPAPWFQQHFLIKYDDEVLLEASQTEGQWDPRYSQTEIHWYQSDIIAERLYQKWNLAQYGLPQPIAERIVSQAIQEADRFQSHRQGIFGVHDMMDAIAVYLHTDIEKILAPGQDDFIKALGILDRRCGKRRLTKYAGYDYTGSPEWLRRFYQIRFEAEGIRYNKHYEIKKRDLTAANRMP